MSTTEQTEQEQDAHEYLSEGAALQREIEGLYSRLASQRKMVFSLVVAVLFCVVAFALLIVGFSQYPKFKYVATTDNSAICNISTTDDLQIGYPTIAQFAKDGLVEVYSFGYVNYRAHLSRATNKWMTANGKRSFLGDLEKSGNLKKVLNERLTLRVMATEVAQVEEEGVNLSGLQYWIVRVPVLVEFFGGNSETSKSREFLATITITRVPPSAERLKGIAIDGILIKPR